MLAAEGLDALALARLARRAAQVEDALARETAAAEVRLRFIETGACEADELFAEPTEIAQRLMTATVASVGGRDASRVGLEKIEALVAGLRKALGNGEQFSANVGGARVRSDGGTVRVGKEPARRKPADITGLSRLPAGEAIRAAPVEIHRGDDGADDDQSPRGQVEPAAADAGRRCRTRTWIVSMFMRLAALSASESQEARCFDEVPISVLHRAISKR